jgi:esterase/lipase
MEYFKSALFQDPKTKHPIYELDLPFSEYSEECRNLIAKTRTDLKHHAEKIITANTPFEIRPNHSKIGVLLIHGLLESPFIMRDIAKSLAEKGLWCRAILLPGHGTVPGDLLSVTYEDWIQALRYGIASFKNKVEKLYLVGFSTGASLALHHVLHHNDIEKVVLIAPAIKIRSRFDFSSNWYHIISWAWDRAKWLNVAEENDYVKYQSIPFNAAYQVYRLARSIKQYSKHHLAKSPLFFVLSQNDRTVSTLASVNYFLDYLQPENRLLLFSKDKRYENTPQTFIRKSIFPEMNIDDISHIALPVSSNNIHYGKHGDYIHASRFHEKKSVIYGAFSKFDNMVYDFLYKHNLTKIKRERLTFNPDFDFLMSEIETFLRACSKFFN